jgi:predicted enzyme related to lactoylglutathione lyase
MGSVKSKTSLKKPKAYLNWFEIPVLDLHRAVSFYNHIYTMQMETIELNGYAMAVFPEKTSIGGALVMGPGCIPSEAGTLVYLNGGNDLDVVLSKINAAGGRVVMGKTFIHEDAGYFALFIDSEGNKLALHSKK